MGMTAADLIAAHKVEEGTFRIEFGGAQPVTFVVRNVKSVPEMAKVRKKALDLLKVSNSGSVPAAWKPYLPITTEVADIVSKLTMLVVEPAFTDLEALELCATGGLFATFVNTEIARRLAHMVVQGEAEELEEAKNALGVSEQTTVTTSSTAPSGETTSPSAATASTESIPTTGTATTGDTPAITSPSP